MTEGEGETGSPLSKEPSAGLDPTALRTEPEPTPPELPRRPLPFLFPSFLFLSQKDLRPREKHAEQSTDFPLLLPASAVLP